MRVLFLSRWYPDPPNNGSKLRIYNLLRGLAKQYEVTLLSFADEPNEKQKSGELQTLCRKVEIVPWKAFNPRSIRARLGFLNSTPRSMVDTFSPDMKQCIEQTLLAEDYDVVIASEIDMAIYSRYFGHLPAVLDELQVSVLYEQFALAKAFRHRLRHGLTWAKHRHFLVSILRNFQACVVASEQERQLLTQAVSDYQAIKLIPNCVDLASYHKIHKVPQPNRLIFTGAFTFFPNYEAMVWFLQKVYPNIQASVPEVELVITGNHADRALPPASNVTLTGFVDDVHSLIAQSWIGVVPLQTGGGTRLKILEAMALGTPVVATSKGAEGLDAQHGKHLLIADTPEAFAHQVTYLLQEPELHHELANNAYQLIREKYDWAVVMPRFLELVKEVARL